MLDPASASVAFIGFAASLATLAGLVVDSIQTLIELRSRLNGAPEELKRLLSVLRQHESILVDLRDRTSTFTSEELSDELQKFWQENNTQMAADYARLKEHVKKIQVTFQGTTVTKKYLRARIQNAFRSPEVQELETRLQGNLSKFDAVLSMVVESRLRKQDHQELQSIRLSTSRTETYLSQQAVQLSGIEHRLRFISSHLKVPAGSNHLFRGRNFQAPSLNQGNHQARRLWPGLPRFARILLAETEGMCLVRRYWFGFLRVKVIRDTIQEDPSSLEAFEDHTYVEFTYIPPRWLSDMCFTVSLTPSARLQLQNVHVNSDPRLFKYLLSCDVQGLQTMFAHGLAHPLDLIPLHYDSELADTPDYPRGGPESLFEASVMLRVLEQ
ncbi:uncharacterized protein Z520_10690 [Fonsecaea multimorphosa CBS 102226]|uniref:Fungal N-terminal domain-containing protein n=1 Tax=Fonsecaea multimorphosa CBS 102226 TaxID=1442371 RepID=A0A0D2JJX1_9EURO|nr:uncharacterized protein Z520_10690 [Fonsecaea multimorphosa CBS 102226]KIX93512.1 hypothetical protein Z520_10690 [Fonsecaea multimorphosa CBS 102226]